MVAGGRLPGIRPATPRIRVVEVAQEHGVRPRPPVVGADLDANDRRATRPRAAFEQVHAPLGDPVAGRELGDAGRRHQRPGPHPRDRPTLLLLGLPHPVAVRDLVAGERLRDDADLGEPLDVRHPVPARHDEAHWEPVLRRDRAAVHLEREERVREVVERQAARVALLDLALDAPVEAREDGLERALERLRLLEQRPHGDPAPARGADRLREPRLAHGPRLEPRPPVAGALHRRGELHRRPRPQVGERQHEGTRDAPADGERPRVRVDRGDVVVDQEVVEADGRHRPAQRLERHAVVAGRELELLEADPRRLHGARLSRCRARANRSSRSRFPSGASSCASCGRPTPRRSSRRNPSSTRSSCPTGRSCGRARWRWPPGG